MTEDLDAYIEQMALVPEGSVCTIDVEILRGFVERTERAEAEVEYWVHKHGDSIDRAERAEKRASEMDLARDKEHQRAERHAERINLLKATAEQWKAQADQLKDELVWQRQWCADTFGLMPPTRGEQRALFDALDES